MVVTSDLPEDWLGRTRFPAAVIRVGEAPSDPEHDEEPDLFGQSFEVTVAVAVTGDPVGQHALLGANRTQNSSPGKGVLEIGEQLIRVIKALGDSSGVRVLHRMKSAVAGTLDEKVGYLAWRSYRFEAILAGTKSYAAPTRFTATPSAGQVVLSWTNPATRYDSRKMLLRRASGASAPATPTDGTAVALAADFSTSKTDTGLLAGTYSYSLFAIYDEYGTSTDAQWSTAVSKTVVVT